MVWFHLNKTFRIQFDARQQSEKNKNVPYNWEQSLDVREKGIGCN